MIPLITPKAKCMESTKLPILINATQSNGSHLWGIKLTIKWIQSSIALRVVE